MNNSSEPMQNQQIVNSEQIQIQENTNKNDKINTVSIISLVASIVCIIIVVSIYNQTRELNGKVLEIESTISSINDKQVEYNANVALRNINEEILANKLSRLDISHEIDGGVVTDQFVVEKSSFYDIAAFIDISTQPIMASKYMGTGNFIIDDRELKKYLIDIVNEVKERYDSYNEYQIYKISPFEDMKIYLTIKNYDIGTYENGTLVLKGE